MSNAQINILTKEPEEVTARGLFIFKLLCGGQECDKKSK